ncbi:MAG TPA: FAD-dependent oxidoreductase [Planctomycetaceae bacterium]|jgi:2-polyprenyl-6-methoxyphenol hydroxylase-like FAD-dependent oxidoreductase|nr:FAD-dependent oxidoreductase [Planctomycetaceae bacterium]
MARNVLIVGAGPAGAALAYLLARRGVAVTLLERHRDFARAFRGEGLQPSGLNALAQMGLGEKVGQLPQVSVNFIELHRGGRLRTRINTEQLGFAAQFVSQPALLEMLAEESRRTSNFQLEMGVSAREFLYEGERVVGVRADTPTGTQVYHADLVVGTDGRHSITRKAGAFTELQVRQNFDVVWFKVPFPDFWPDHATVRLELGPGYISGGIPSSDGQLQTGFTIAKGTFPQLRAQGAEGWIDEIIQRLAPDLAAHLRAHVEFVSRTVLLDVLVGRLISWTKPGLLLLGDAAHPMSPIGGQGLNVALRDALVAANHLCPVLATGASPPDIDAAAEHVAEEPMPEIVALQEHQHRQAKLFLEPRWTGRLAIRLLPLLARAGILPLLLGKRLQAFQHGVVPVNLTV